MVNAARAEGRIIGNAQSTGTYLHAAASEQQAVRALSQGADTVYFDRALSTVTGTKGFSPNIRPDMTAVFDDGAIRLTEVVSKTQNYGQMSTKLDGAIAQLESFGFSATSDVVGKAFSFSSPFGGTIGAANLSMDAFGAGVTFGSQSLYQDANNYSAISGMSAGGGFLLYPNKANLNMMQSVYAK